MVLSDNGYKLIMAFEGFSPTVYYCSAGVPTIGYGHAITSAEEEARYRATPLTKQAALSLLQTDTKKAVRSVLTQTHVPLNQNQFDALVDFTFNLGGGAYQRSTLRQLLNRADYTSAANEFPRWCKANGRPVAGLLRRRLVEQKIFLS
jgi:lysozyme